MSKRKKNSLSFSEQNSSIEEDTSLTSSVDEDTNCESSGSCPGKKC